MFKYEVFVIDDAILILVDKCILNRITIFVVYLFIYIECIRGIPYTMYLDVITRSHADTSGGHSHVVRIEDGGQFRNFRFAPGSVYTDIPRKVFCNNRSGIDVDFNTLILQITDIGGHLIRKIRTGGNGNGV